MLLLYITAIFYFNILFVTASLGLLLCLKTIKEFYREKNCITIINLIPTTILFIGVIYNLSYSDNHILHTIFFVSLYLFPATLIDNVLKIIKIGRKKYFSKLRQNKIVIYTTGLIFTFLPLFSIFIGFLISWYIPEVINDMGPNTYPLTVVKVFVYNSTLILSILGGFYLLKNLGTFLFKKNYLLFFTLLSISSSIWVLDRGIFGWACVFYFLYYLFTTNSKPYLKKIIYLFTGAFIIFCISAAALYLG